MQTIEEPRIKEKDDIEADIPSWSETVAIHTLMDMFFKMQDINRF